MLSISSEQCYTGIMDNTDKIIRNTSETDVKDTLETERKFLVNTPPENIEQYPNEKIIQGYLIISKDETELRLRQEGEKYFQTVKSKTESPETRIEKEIEISQEQFHSLWGMTQGRRVEKTRYKIPFEEKTIDLDIYHGELEGLISAEIEFANKEDSENFTPPTWLSNEVTKDKRYKNQNLARYGSPTEKLNIPEYELEKGIAKLVSSIKEKMLEKDGNIVVQIAGGSASGKTSAVAQIIKESFETDSIILSADDYYKGKTFMQSELEKGNELNWDQPEALNLELFKQHLVQLKTGQRIEKPIYDMKTSEPVGTEEVSPKKIIIVEGLFALNEILGNLGDVKTFVDIGTHGRILRRLLRDISRTGQKPSDILRYFSEIVEPMHEKYIQNTKQNADFVIKNEYSPEVEAERSGLHEIQLKFEAGLDSENLRNLGAEKLSTTIQIDKYYNPKDRDLIQTGEILRIREEGGKKTLTYKGPQNNSEFRERAKFEFDIDDDTEKAFLNIYGSMSKTIAKERTIYQLNGVIFSIDRVYKNESGEEQFIGNFIEVRSTDKDSRQEQIQNVIQQLGLDLNKGVKKSYFEM